MIELDFENIMDKPFFIYQSGSFGRTIVIYELTEVEYISSTIFMHEVNHKKNNSKIFFIEFKQMQSSTNHIVAFAKTYEELVEQNPEYFI